MWCPPPVPPISGSFCAIERLMRGRVPRSLFLDGSPAFASALPAGPPGEKPAQRALPLTRSGSWPSARSIPYPAAAVPAVGCSTPFAQGITQPWEKFCERGAPTPWHRLALMDFIWAVSSVVEADISLDLLKDTAQNLKAGDRTRPGPELKLCPKSPPWGHDLAWAWTPFSWNEPYGGQRLRRPQ